MNTKHTLRLLGGEHLEVRVSLSALLEVMSAYLDSVTLATRLAVEGHSSRRGRTPTWLKNARDSIEITGLEPGSTALSMEAYPLSSIDREKFREAPQLELLSLDEEEESQGSEENVGCSSPLELWDTIARSIYASEDQDIDVDRSLLDSILQFTEAVFESFEGAEFSNGNDQATPLRIEADAIDRIRRLRDKTPESHAIRLTGTLDTISHSKSNAALVLPDGTRISVTMEEHEPDQLRSLFGQSVVVSGIVHYNAKGSVKDIDVEHIDRAHRRDAMFSALPTTPKSLDEVLEEGQKTGARFADFIGRWPGDETDEELQAALRAIR